MIDPFANPLVTTVSAICSEDIKLVTHKKDQIDMYQNGRNGRGKDNKRYLLTSM
jgi:hypothetical protein